MGSDCFGFKYLKRIDVGVNKDDLLCFLFGLIGSLFSLFSLPDLRRVSGVWGEGEASWGVSGNTGDPSFLYEPRPRPASHLFFLTKPFGVTQAELNLRAGVRKPMFLF